MSFCGEVALVTGASRGIGKATAARLAESGAVVVGTATTEEGAQRIGENLAPTGGSGVVLDVTNDASVRELFDRFKRESRSPYIVVNNAGITRDNLLVRMNPDEWSDVIDTNLNSLYRVSRACTRDMMKARKGRIINLTSVVGAMGNAGQANYAAAKAGIMGFTRALARELGPRGITVNAIAPGFINTDMTQNLSEEQRERLLDQVPLKRLGEAVDVADAVVFLAGPMAAYITGTTLHVNGGMYMN